MANVSATLEMINKKGLDKVIATGEALDKMRSAIVRKVGNVDIDIHIWLLSEIKDIEKHRNPTKLNQTVSLLTGTGARTTAIHMFIQTFANVVMTNNVKQPGQDKSERATLSEGKDYTVFYKVKKERSELSFFTGRKDGKATYSEAIAYDRSTEKGMDEYLKLAASKPWWEFRPEPEARPFDFDNVAKGVANSIKRTFAEVHSKGSFEGMNKDFIGDLYKVVAQYYPELAKDVTTALENELPKDAPKELSNVIKFKPKAAQEEEKPHPETQQRRRGNSSGRGNRAGK